MDTVAIDKLQYLQIGQQGDHNSLEVPIDMTSWVEEFPDSQLRCFVLFVPPGEKNPWPMTSTYDTDTHILTWEVTANATAVEGQGYMEVRALEMIPTEEDPDTHEVLYDGLVKKSRVIPTLIDHSVSGIVGGSRPAPYQDFLNQVLTVKAQLNEIFANAELTYAISNSYQSPPETGWDDDMPDLVENKGKYLWSRTTINWATGSSSHLYNVSYIAEDASGAVTSVNGKTGAVVMDGSDILVNRLQSGSPTLQAAVNSLLSLTNPLPASNGGTGETSLLNAIRVLMNAAPNSSDVPGADDKVLVGANGFASVTRRTVASLLSAENIHSGSGGYVLKQMVVPLTRATFASTTSFDTSRGKAVFRTGHFVGTLTNFPIENIPLMIDIPYWLNGMVYSMPLFSRQNSSQDETVTWDLNVDLNYTQMQLGSSFDTSLINNVLGTLYYLAAE